MDAERLRDNKTYQLNKPLNVVIGLTTNGDKNSSVSDIVKHVTDRDDSMEVSRKASMIYNILI